MDNANVSVVIPVYKPNIKELKEQINLLLLQSIKPLEIIVIHTMTGDDLSIIKSMDRVKYLAITPDEFDHGATRARGVEESVGDYIIFLTQDAIIKNKFLIEELLKPFDNPLVAISYGRQIARKDGTLLEKYTRLFNYPKEDKIKGKADIKKLGIKTYFCSDVCSCYKKSIYEKLGGFPSPAIFNEDMVMAYEAIINDYYVYYASKAMVMHSHDYTNKQNFKRNFDMGVSQTQFDYIFDSVSSEKEGASYAKTIILNLLCRGKIGLIFKFVGNCFSKLLGYKLGRKYQSIPVALARKCTTNPAYLDKFYLN